MQQSPEDRQKALASIKRLLSTPDGEMFVDELQAAWDPYRLIGDTPEDTAYNVALRDAYYFVRSLQRGDDIRE